MNEIFKDIVGYENHYKISNLGNLFSTPQDGKPHKLLKQEVVKSNTTNYRRVSLCKNGKVKRFMIHRLVSKAFINNPKMKPYINHIDNNGENNNIDNLEWCTHSENMIHAQKQGRLFKAQSKGGKSRGIAGKKHDERIDSSLNKIFGYWKILYILPIKETLNSKRKAVCLCTKCMNHAKMMQLEPVLTNKTTMCTGCSLRKNNEKQKKIQNKQIIQLSKDMDYIASYPSLTDASNSISLDKDCTGHISKVCSGKSKTAYGYIWKYAKQNIKDIS